MSEERGEGAEAAEGAAPKGGRALRAASSAPAGEATEALGPINPGLAFRVALPGFEGPLDLLLHLIREHKVDILDIPIALITEKYLDSIQQMEVLNLDIAGEFVLMAATLAHIKSRMLLPNPEPMAEEKEEVGDPRAELVRRLLTYQKYKAAAEELGRQDLLSRDVFTRSARVDQIPLSEGEVGLVEVSVFKLVEALDRALKNARVQIPHQVFVDRISMGDAISNLIDRLKAEPKLSFFAILADATERVKIVVTFLALLEMCKLGLIRIYQDETQDIVVSAKHPEALTAPAEIEDEYK